MVELKRSQIRSVEETMAYPQGFGYVLDFSDRTISEFFEDEFGIDFDDSKYAANARIAEHPAIRLDDLLPWTWQTRQAAMAA